MEADWDLAVVVAAALEAVETEKAKAKVVVAQVKVMEVETVKSRLHSPDTVRHHV